MKNYIVTTTIVFGLILCYLPEVSGQNKIDIRNNVEIQTLNVSIDYSDKIDSTMKLSLDSIFHAGIEKFNRNLISYQLVYNPSETDYFMHFYVHNISYWRRAVCIVRYNATKKMFTYPKPPQFSFFTPDVSRNKELLRSKIKLEFHEGLKAFYFELDLANQKNISRHIKKATRRGSGT